MPALVISLFGGAGNIPPAPGFSRTTGRAAVFKTDSDPGGDTGAEILTRLIRLFASLIVLSTRPVKVFHEPLMSVCAKSSRIPSRMVLRGVAIFPKYFAGDYDRFSVGDLSTSLLADLGNAFELIGGVTDDLLILK